MKRISPQDLPTVLESIQISKDLLCKWQQEFRVIYPTGEMRWLSASAIPERLVDGTVMWSGFTSDVTERKHAEEQLMQASLQTPLLDCTTDSLQTLKLLASVLGVAFHFPY